MRVTGIGFLGVRTRQFDATRHFYKEVMGLELTRAGSDVAGFRLAGQTTVEVYGPDDIFHAFFTTGPVIGFRVENFDEAHAELCAAHVEFIGVIQHEGGTSWSHFRGPDGNVYEILGPGQPRDERGVPVASERGA